MSAPTTASSQQHIFRKLLKHRSATIGASIILFFIVVAIFAPLIATHDPRQANIVERLQGGSASHYLGTDKVGRDIFSRIVYGTRISLKVGLIAMTFSVGFGTLFGAIAGYYGGRIDNLIMRVMDMMLAMPSILLAMVIVTILGQSLTNAIIAVSIVYIPQYARILRASVLKVRELDYVVAAKVIGASNSRILVTTVLPNCLAPLIVQATLGIGAAILDAAGLSFLGLGAEIGEPEWGAMLNENRDLIRRAPLAVTAPGVAIFLIVLGFNLLGDALRDALDPQID
ncbi:ABC transporter permease [Candidatus Poribacteria bacterium]|nr:ABC transporter permease [Candidatus Poribacteria bacterium]MDE0397952.1 ABC transporter permease [Candidatus Poribacteria bacterium]MYA69255.1 ABC transporter permease [Candidatus Poribacteria bacterium]MYH82876.1 ABC transporter permease [Candidatus Poribacteria bacterium]MYK92490.1 ABC transporter permease [Candidatus Poribacteria bacterium]